MSPSVKGLDPKSEASNRKMPPGKGLKCFRGQGWPCEGHQGHILTFLPWASKMLCRDTSTSSPSSRTPFPLGMRMKEGVVGSVSPQKIAMTQVQWPMPESALQQKQISQISYLPSPGQTLSVLPIWEPPSLQTFQKLGHGPKYRRNHVSLP